MSADSERLKRQVSEWIEDVEHGAVINEHDGRALAGNLRELLLYVKWVEEEGSRLTQTAKQARDLGYTAAGRGEWQQIWQALAALALRQEMA